MRLSRRKPSPPIRRWTQRPRVVLLGLIGANLAVFVAQLFLDAYQPGFVREYLALSDEGLRSAYGWQFITAAFLHDGPWHLLGNMFLLYLLGRDVESIIGQRQFPSETTFPRISWLVAPELLPEMMVLPR